MLQLFIGLLLSEGEKQCIWMLFKCSLFHFKLQGTLYACRFLVCVVQFISEAVSVFQLTLHAHIWIEWKVLFCFVLFLPSGLSVWLDACHTFCHVALTPAGQLHYSSSIVMLMLCYLRKGQICKGQWGCRHTFNLCIHNCFWWCR